MAKTRTNIEIEDDFVLAVLANEVGLARIAEVMPLRLDKASLRPQP